MKNTGKCPKCGGQEILTVLSERMYENDPYLRAGGALSVRADGVNITRYVCKSCGYLEQWADLDEPEWSRMVRYWEKKATEERAYQQECRESLERWNRKAAEQKGKA